MRKKVQGTKEYKEAEKHCDILLSHEILNYFLIVISPTQFVSLVYCNLNNYCLASYQYTATSLLVHCHLSMLSTAINMGILLR